MHEADREDFTILIEAMAATLPPQKEVSKAMFTGYWLGLCDIALDAVRCGVERAIRSCKFMPSPAELRELSGEMKPEQRAIIAWDAFEKATRSVGWYNSVEFDDPLIHATVRNLGGWCRVIERIEDEDKIDKWVRKDFERVYRAMAETGISEDQARPLVGNADAQNEREGFVEWVRPPIKVNTGLPLLPGLRAPAGDTQQAIEAAVKAIE